MLKSAQAWPSFLLNESANSNEAVRRDADDEPHFVLLCVIDECHPCNLRPLALTSKIQAKIASERQECF